MPEIILQKFANREIRTGIQQIRRPSRNYGDRAAERRSEYEHKMFSLSQCQVVETMSSAYMVSSNKDECSVVGKDGAEAARNAVRYALDITREFQQARAVARTRKKDYGTDNRSTVFTKSARHRLLEAGAVATRWSAQNGTGFFITLTLPGSTTDAIRTLARYSGYICNRLTQVIRRAEGESIWFYAWEWQKRGALHLHLYLSCDTTERGVSVAIDIVTVWYKALNSVSAKSGVDLYLRSGGRGRAPSSAWQFDIRPVTYGSAAAYVSKYVGKGAKSPRKGSGFQVGKQLYYPARWWGISRNLKRMTDDERTDIRITGLTDDEARYVLELIDSQYVPRERIATYSYSFEIFLGREADRTCIGTGIRWIHYCSDNAFAGVGVGFGQLLRFVLHRFPLARLEYRYGNPVKPKPVIASMHKTI